MRGFVNLLKLPISVPETIPPRWQTTEFDGAAMRFSGTKPHIATDELPAAYRTLISLQNPLLVLTTNPVRDHRGAAAIADTGGASSESTLPARFRWPEK